MSFGEFGFLPLQVGGEPTPEEKAYRALRSNVGLRGSARDPNTVEDTWRWSKAIGLAAVSAFDERALYQSFPDTATDRVKNYEELLRIVAASTSTDEDRRRAIAALWTLKHEVAGPDLRAALSEIDPRLSVLEQTAASSSTTYHGRAFEDHDANESFASPAGTYRSTAFPNYADDFVVTVLFNVGGSGVPTVSDARVVSSVETLLNDRLPAWVNFRIVTSVGFILDTSPLDVTGFGS